MTRISISLDGEEVQASLAALQIPVETDSEMMLQIGELLRESSEESFRVQRAPDGTPWAPLAESTAKEKARKGYSPLSLIRGGRLQTLTHRALDYPPSAVVGTNILYAEFHQFGTERDGKTLIPARPFLGLRESYRRAITDLVLQDISDKWAADA